MNDGHPEIIDAYVINVTPESIHNVGNAMRLIYTYRQLIPNIQTTIGVRTIMLPTTEFYVNPDVTDTLKPMKLTYKYPADYTPDPDKAGEEEQQGVDLEVSLDLPTFTITRTEWLTNLADAESGYGIGKQLTGEILTDRGLKFNNRLNKANWDLRPIAIAGRWKLKMTAESTENTFDWRVTYNFTHDEGLWKYPATYQDPQLDQPIPDPVEQTNTLLDGNFFKFDQYRRADFNKLGLS